MKKLMDLTWMATTMAQKNIDNPGGNLTERRDDFGFSGGDRTTISPLAKIIKDYKPGKLCDKVEREALSKILRYQNNGSMCDILLHCGD
jgi:hypothetical protein